MVYVSYADGVSNGRQINQRFNHYNLCFSRSAKLLSTAISVQRAHMWLTNIYRQLSTPKNMVSTSRTTLLVNLTFVGFMYDHNYDNILCMASMMYL